MLEARSTINLTPGQTDSLPPVLRVTQTPQQSRRSGQGTGVPRRDSMYLESEFVVWLLISLYFFCLIPLQSELPVMPTNWPSLHIEVD